MPTSTDSLSQGVTKTRSRSPCSNHQLSISPPSTVTHDDRSRTQEWKRLAGRLILAGCPMPLLRRTTGYRRAEAGPPAGSGRGTSARQFGARTQQQKHSIADSRMLRSGR
jgi:hypothetical protein